MKITKLFLLMLGISFCYLSALGQGIGINSTGASPDPSSGLDVDFNDRGVLIPRLTTIERNAISNPADGLLIYNTDTKCINMWDNSTWKQSCFDCAFAQPVASNNGPLCEGATLNLTANTISGATYSWTGPNGFSSSQQNPSISNITSAAAGNYQLVVTAGGCTASAVFTSVTVNAVPSSPPASSNSPVCEGATLNLSASFISGASYSWTGPNGFGSSQQTPSVSNITSAGAGTYTVTATVNGCSSSPNSTTVIVNALPNAGFTYNPTSPYESQSVAFTPNTSGGSSYSWTFASGLPASSSAQNPSVSWSTSGSYSVGLSLTDNNGCSNSSSSSITIDPIPFKRIFVTSTSYTGSMGGLSGADANCQARANAASLGGTWMAWLSSSSVNASSRLNHGTIPYKLLNGTLIANDWSDLTDGNLANPINYTELGTTLSGQRVWTNSSGAGNAINGGSGLFDCNAWTLSSSGGNDFSAAGNTSQTLNDRWSWDDPPSDISSGRCYKWCNTSLPLYCIEQ